MTTDVTAAAPSGESDFSIRKIKIAFAVLLGTLFGSSILSMMAIGLLTLPMTEEFGWTRTQYSGGLTAMMLAGALSSPFLGRLVDKIGVRLMIIGGTVIVGLLTMSLALQDGSLWRFYAGFGAVGFAGSTAIGYAKVIGALFTKHRGKALALFGVESSLAGAVTPPLISYLIETHGWRGMFVALGAIILAVVPVLLIWLKEPEAPSAEAGAPAGAAEAPGLTVGEALATRDFWFILIAGVLALAPFTGFQPHLIPFIVSRGIPLDTAVWMLSLMLVATAAGSVIAGFLLDRFDSAKIAAPFGALSALSLAVMVLLTGGAFGVAILFFATVAKGVAFGASRPMATVFQLRFFGLKSFATLYGIQAPFQAVCMGLAPLAVGMSYDRLGSYEPAFIALAVLMVVTVFLYLGLGRYRFAKDLTPVG